MMSEIKLFSIDGEVKEIKQTTFTLEKELQNIIEKNMQLFFGVTFLGSEYVIPNGRMDSIGIDENNCPVIFEYKRSVNENVINQGLFYLDWLLDHKANFELLVLKKFGKEKADAIDWSMPCVICIANDFTKYDVHAVNQMQRNIKLVRYRRYGNELLLFEFLNDSQETALPISSLSNSLSSENSEINSTKNGAKTFSQRLEEAPVNIKNIYFTVRDYILSLGDDVSENILRYYVAFRKVKNIVCVEVFKNKLILHLRLDPDTVELKEGFIEDERNKGHWGTGDLEVIIKTPEDFERCKPLIDRTYNEN